jgi:hypothetical protein
MTKPSIPTLSNLPAPIQRVIAPIRDEILKLSDRVVEQERQITTLEDLLRGSKATRTTAGEFALPPVTGYRVVTGPNSITIYLSAVGAGAGPTNSPLYVTELWRSVGSSSSSGSALIVRETTRFSLEDHPPPGEVYRYWLRYRSLDGTQTGPFTPANGITLATQEAANPEDLFDPTNGGVFLETFEGEDFPARWVRRQGGGSTIDYQLSGVVGGKVARVVGGDGQVDARGRLVHGHRPDGLRGVDVGLRPDRLAGGLVGDREIDAVLVVVLDVGQAEDLAVHRVEVKRAGAAGADGIAEQRL